MKRTKIVFFGTPHFSEIVLDKLIGAGYDIVAVFTQPDKKVGRKQVLSFSPVKKLAARNNIRIYQPETLRDESTISKIQHLKPGLIIVAAYGKILPEAVLAIPRLGALNVHASLLPKYRGASPVQEALLRADLETGITIMLMDEGMDTGDILTQEKAKISNEDTAITLEGKLAARGAELLAKTIPDWVAEKIQPRKQEEEFASYCKIVRKEDGKIDWTDSAEFVFRKWRAYQPWPGIYTHFGEKRLRLAEIETRAADGVSGKPGKVIKYNQGTAVATGEGLVVLKKIQLEGKKTLDISEFLRGHRDFADATLS